MQLILEMPVILKKRKIITHSLFPEVSPTRMMHLHFADTKKKFVGIKDVLKRCDSCSVSVRMECECKANT